MTICYNLKIEAECTVERSIIFYQTAWRPVLKYNTFQNYDMSFRFLVGIKPRSRSRSPRGLRRASADARLLGLWVRIRPEA